MINIDYRRALAGLPRTPEPCPRHGPRARFQIDGYYLYACSVCEAAPWGSHEGVYHGPLRAACDPAWAWVPSSQRVAVAAFGMLGASPVVPAAEPRLRLDVLDGCVWASDRVNGLRLDIEERWIASVLDDARRVCDAEILRGRVAYLVASPGYVEVARPGVRFAVLVHELYPDATWCARGDGMLVAWVGDRAVATAGPEIVERRAA